MDRPHKPSFAVIVVDQVNQPRFIHPYSLLSFLVYVPGKRGSLRAKDRRASVRHTKHNLSDENQRPVFSFSLLHLFVTAGSRRSANYASCISYRGKQGYWARTHDLATRAWIQGACNPSRSPRRSEISL